jgi:hypothetical protein
MKTLLELLMKLIFPNRWLFCIDEKIKLRADSKNLEYDVNKWKSGYLLLLMENVLESKFRHANIKIFLG